MGSEQLLMRMDLATTGRCQQYALHAFRLRGIVGCLNSTLGSLVADDITRFQKVKHCVVTAIQPVICISSKGVGSRS